MTIAVDQPARDICQLCRLSVEQTGSFLIDDQGTRKFLCDSHATALLQLVLEPLQTVTVEM